MKGRISVAFLREPSFAEAQEVEGERRKGIVVYDKSAGKIVALASRSIKSCYVNGLPCEIGYLSGLRIEKGYRGGFILARGYSFLKKLHQEESVGIYFTTIIEDNTYARSLLTSRRAGLPAYCDA